MHMSYASEMMSVMYRLSMFNPEDLNVQLLRVDNSQLLQDANQLAEVR